MRFRNLFSRRSDLRAAGNPAVALQLFILALLALPYLINIGKSSLWDANEAFYAETPREMLEKGDYLAPQFNYQVRAQKPPLTYWAVLASYKLFGIHEFAVRFPGALAAVGVIFFTYGIGKALENARAGLTAAAIIATSMRVFLLARKLPIDILLLFWLTGCAFFLVRAIQKDSGRFWALAYLFASLGFMTKGPIAFIIPGASYLIWTAWNRKFSPRAFHPLVGLAVVAMTVLPWYLLIYAKHGFIYISTFFLKDNFARFATESFGPARGPMYYPIAYFSDFLPWSILSIGAIYLILGNHAGTERTSLSYGFGLVWIVVVISFFTLSRNKQEYYIAPVFPIVAVLLGLTLERTLFSKKERICERTWSAGFFAASLACLILALVVIWLSGLVRMRGVSFLQYAPSVVLLMSFVALGWNLTRKKIASCFVSLAVPVYMLYFLTAQIYLPAFEAYRPVKELCGTIQGQATQEDAVGYYRTSAPSMAFYLRRPIFEEYDADTMVRRFSSGARVFCLLSEEDYDFFVGKKELILYVLDRRPRVVAQMRRLIDAHQSMKEDLLLVSNRLDVETGPRIGRETP